MLESRIHKQQRAYAAILAANWVQRMLIYPSAQMPLNAADKAPARGYKGSKASARSMVASVGRAFVYIGASGSVEQTVYQTQNTQMQ